MSSGLSEETKRIITLKIKYDNPWAFKNRIAYCRKRVRNGTMTEEVFNFIKEAVEKRKKGEALDLKTEDKED